MELTSPLCIPFRVAGRGCQASNGTVVTRPIAELTDILGSGIKVTKIWQSLSNLNGEIQANNQALIELAVFGDYQLSAEGVWRAEADKRSAQVAFDAFINEASQPWLTPKTEYPVGHSSRRDSYPYPEKPCFSVNSRNFSHTEPVTHFW